MIKPFSLRETFENCIQSGLPLMAPTLEKITEVERIKTYSDNKEH